MSETETVWRSVPKLIEIESSYIPHMDVFNETLEKWCGRSGTLLLRNKNKMSGVIVFNSKGSILLISRLNGVLRPMIIPHREIQAVGL